MALGYEVLVFFALLGAGLKIIDDIYDREVLSRGIAYFLAPVLIALWLFLSFHDEGAATLLSAILVSSVLAGKVDNPVFGFSAVILLVTMLLGGVDLALLPFLFLAALGVIDEFANNRADSTGGASFFLKHRFGMKLGVLLLFALSQLELVYAVALLVFDLAYDSASVALPRRIDFPAVGEVL
jgi:hypothetical protein